MITLSPARRHASSPANSEAALLAAYGVSGASGSSSVRGLGSPRPYTSAVETSSTVLREHTHEPHCPHEVGLPGLLRIRQRLGVGTHPGEMHHCVRSMLGE